MKESVLLLGIHCHQPEGNFSQVFSEAFEGCYRPLLEALWRHPSVKVALHYSGPLLEWLEEHQPLYLDKIREIQDRGQAEILGGGFYEPILPSLPPEDARNQVSLFSEYLEKAFSRSPQGIWLTERVWAPCLASLLPRAGIHYTILDDIHFLSAGLCEGDLHGYFLTEGEGKPLALFPIRKTLRYSIPFAPAEKVLEVLKKEHDEKGPKVLTYADDGEKFGLWPGTHLWVYEKGWLETFLSLLEKNSGWLRTMTFSECCDTFPPTGRVYIPTASYEEMMTWALPVKSQGEYESLLKEMEAKGLRDRARGFLRGGWWENFMMKYPEANLLHKKMLSVGERLRKARRKGRIPEKVWRRYYRAQANDAYWHGLFGGLYFHFLRRSAYSHLVSCEKEIDRRRMGRGSWVRVERDDMNADGKAETLLASPSLQALIAPHEGGALLELDWRVKPLNLTNVLTRRPEPYHLRLSQSPSEAPSVKQEDAGPKTIHHIHRVKDKGLEALLMYDLHQRWSFLDHIFSSDISLDTWIHSKYEEKGDFVCGSYAIVGPPRKDKQECSVTMRRDGTVRCRGGATPLTVEKTFFLKRAEPTCGVQYMLQGPGFAESLWFGVEFNLGLLIGYDRKRHLLFGDVQEGTSSGEREGVKGVSIIDDTEGLSIALDLAPPGRLWWFLIETVSNSEEGIERTPQGVALLALWPLMPAGPAHPLRSFSLGLTVTPRKTYA